MNQRQKLIRNVIELLNGVSRNLRDDSITSWITLNLTMSQFKVLLLIAAQECTTTTQLAASLEVTPANITGMVDRLVSQGLVSRQENPDDRRALLLKATEEGKRFLAILREERMTQLSQVLEQMSGEGLSALEQGLAELTSLTKIHKQRQQIPN